MPATGEQIAAFLASDRWTYAEKRVIRLQFHWWNDDDDEFEPMLWQAIKRADEENLKRLAKGFPEQIAGFMAWTHGDLGERLRAAGLWI